MDKNAGVYLIKNIENGKEYVGSSCNIKRRIYKHFYRLNRGTHHNPYLQNVYNFDQPLVAGALYFCHPSEMRGREQKEIDTRDPEYNLVKNVCGQKYGKNHEQSKTYKVINPKGAVITIRGIVKFLDDNNLQSSSFYKVLNGELYQYYGWRKFNPQEIGKEINPREYDMTPILLDPSGGIVKVRKSLSSFCAEHEELNITTLSKVVQGKCYQHKGWRLYKKEEEGKEYTKPYSLFYKLKSSSGKVIEGTPRQLEKYGCTRQGLSNLKQGRQKTHNNFKLINVS